MLIYDEFGNVDKGMLDEYVAKIKRLYLGRMGYLVTFSSPWIDSRTGKEVTPVPKVFLDAFKEIK